MDGGVERQQNRQQVADRRRRAQIAAQGGPIAYLPRGEPGQHLVERRKQAGQLLFQPMQRDGRADAHLRIADLQLLQAVHAIQADIARSIAAAMAELNAEIGAACNPLGLGVGLLHAQCAVQVHRDLPVGAADHRQRIAGCWLCSRG